MKIILVLVVFFLAFNFDLDVDLVTLNPSLLKSVASKDAKRMHKCKQTNKKIHMSADMCEMETIFETIIHHVLSTLCFS